MRRGNLSAGTAPARPRQLTPEPGSQGLVQSLDAGARPGAVVTDCIHNRARLYHIHHRPLYHMIGEPGSRYRRTVPARSAAERLMRLDAALTDPNLDWLTTTSEKVAFLQAAFPADDPVNATNRDGPELADQLPGTFPIGLDPSGRVVLYLATVPWTDDFRTFLVGHVALLRVATTWTLRVVFPQSLRRAVGAYSSVVHEELESPLQADTINDLKRYFFHRRRGTDPNAIPEALRSLLSRWAEAFAGPRFTHLYRRWLTEDEAALQPVSPLIQEALASSRAQVECLVLPYNYEHLSPLVSRHRVRRRRLRQRTREGTRLGAASTQLSTPLLNPPAT